MATLINLSIDASKITKSKMKDGKYVNVTISVNDEANEWGKNVSIYEEQTKEERESKAKRNYIGSGKVVWTDGKSAMVPQKQEDQAPKQAQVDELPF